MHRLRRELMAWRCVTWLPWKVGRVAIVCLFLRSDDCLRQGYSMRDHSRAAAGRRGNQG